MTDKQRREAVTNVKRRQRERFEQEMRERDAALEAEARGRGYDSYEQSIEGWE